MQGAPEPFLPQDTPSQAERTDYEAQLRAAPDYLEFARSLVAAARAGDHAAQFYIFRALEYCTVEYRFHFGGRGRRTLDDALKWAATHFPYDSETVRLVYARCHTFVESGAKDLGKRGEWLRLASDGGYPLAQVNAAKRQKLEGVSAAGDEAARYEESLRLVSLAIRSREPAVMWEVGNSLFKDADTDSEGDVDDLAWLYAACLRGFDCTAQSDAVRDLCRYDPNCQPYESVADVFRRARGNDFPALEADAGWINEKLDAGDWEALGF